VAELRVSSEDRFGLIDLSGPAADLLPNDQQMAEIAATAIDLRREWEILWDLRDLGPTIYNDTRDALLGVASLLPGENHCSAPPVPFTLLIPAGRKAEAEEAFRPLPVKVIEMLPKALPHRQLDLEEFDEFVHRREDQELYDAYQSGGPMSARRVGEIVIGPPARWSPAMDRLLREGWLQEAVDEDFSAAALQISRMATLDQALQQATTTSVLTAMALTLTDGHVHVTPYHGGGLHHTTTPTDAAVLLRPARINHRYWATFQTAIEQLEALVNQPQVRESEIESLLVANPLFLRSLGYRDIYHQVVLPRTAGPNLRPDVIAEPAGSPWAEILDLKLPSAKVLVGRGDRVRMSAALSEAVAQLREYGAFFDDRRAAAQIEHRLGIRCYRPKLTVIIGRDPSRFSPEEQRRALTAHPDLQVVTYDDLLRAARTRLLL
jgi:hypothetical protein